LTAKVTAKESHVGGSLRTPANVPSKAVGEYGRLRLLVNIVLSAWETDALSPELRGQTCSDLRLRVFDSARDGPTVAS
jgi:hypothetical protein